MTEPSGTWTDADLVALDLEGSGGQDRDGEAILEIALVPLVAGRPAVVDACWTLINPGRPIPARPWVSPGLTDAVLQRAPHLERVAPEIARRVDGRIIVGHNVGVDWRLLQRRIPDVAPAGVLDTLRLTRHLRLGPRLGLGALLERLGLTATVDHLAAGSRPHRALWDAVGAGALLHALASQAWPASIGIKELTALAGLPTEAAGEVSVISVEQDALF